MSRICLIYLGSKGGGARLTRDLYQELKELGMNTKVIFKKGAEFSDRYGPSGNSNLEVALPSSKLLLLILGPLYCFKINYKLSRQLHKDDLLIFVMPHPYNIKILRKFSKKIDVTTVSIVHDHQAHSGEIWPTKREIKRIINKSDRIIFLSNYVMSKFPYRSKFIATKLEAVPILVKPFPRRDSRTLIVPGRLKKYKGLSSLLNLSTMLQGDFLIKVVGEGSLESRLDSESIVVETGWLSSVEFDTEIASAAALLNIYSDATQSGPVAIAKAYGIPVISNGIGGIMEQLADYPASLILNDHSDVRQEIQEFVNRFRAEKFPENSASKMQITEIVCSLSRKSV